MNAFRRLLAVILAIAILGGVYLSRDILARFLIITSSVPARFVNGISEQFHRPNTVLEKENAQLRSENTRFLTEKVQLEEEIAALHHQISNEPFFARRSWEYVYATVIGRPLPTEERFIIDRGIRDGVQMGAPVLSNDAIFVGVIVTVSDHHAAYRSILDPAVQVAVRIGGNEQAHAIARGEHGVGIGIEYLSAEVGVKSGDTVITSGLGGGVPAGIPVGTLDTLQRTEGDLFATASVKQPKETKNPRFVTVIRLPEI